MRSIILLAGLLAACASSPTPSAPNPSSGAAASGVVAARPEPAACVVPPTEIKSAAPASLPASGSGQRTSKTMRPKGSLPKAAISAVIKADLDEVTACYVRQLDRDGDLAGKVSVHFVIGPDGSVQRAALRESTMNDEAVEICVVNRACDWQFPEPEGGGIVVVTYPFVFATTEE